MKFTTYYWRKRYGKPETRVGAQKSLALLGELSLEIQEVVDYLASFTDLEIETRHRVFNEYWVQFRHKNHYLTMYLDRGMEHVVLRMGDKRGVYRLVVRKLPEDDLLKDVITWLTLI